jgi:hypothetical protein
LVIRASVIDGYTTPDDNNSNSNYDFQEASAAPPITTQPSNTVICPDCSTTITVVATNVTSYQLQIFNGVSWVNLTNTGVHSGTTSGTLVINIALPSINANQYRVILTNSSYVCSTTTSNTATLTYQVHTVISNRRITYRLKKN